MVHLSGRLCFRSNGRQKKSGRHTHFPEDWISTTTKQDLNKGRAEIVEGLSEITFNGQKIYLSSLFEKYPIELLGKSHFEKYGANTQLLTWFKTGSI